MTENKSLNMHLNIRCSSPESQFFQADVILTNHSHRSTIILIESHCASIQSPTITPVTGNAERLA